MLTLRFWEEIEEALEADPDFDLTPEFRTGITEALEMYSIDSRTRPRDRLTSTLREESFELWQIHGAAIKMKEELEDSQRVVTAITGATLSLDAAQEALEMLSAHALEQARARDEELKRWANRCGRRNARHVLQMSVSRQLQKGGVHVSALNGGVFARVCRVVLRAADQIDGTRPKARNAATRHLRKALERIDRA